MTQLFRFDRRNMTQSHTLFISDLHLSEEEPLTTKIFLNFLENQAKAADALYILGDFFEVWIGDDDRSEYNNHITKALRRYTASGIPTYLMHGNRDFLIGKRFAKATGVRLLKEPTIIELYQTPILLLHGDSLCTLDIKHQKSRKTMHNRFYQRMVLMLPLRIRRHYADQIRSKSRHRKKNIANNIMDVTPNEVTRVMSEAQVQTLIHGHTHRPAIHSIEINQQAAKRIVLGAWHHQGSYLRYDKDGRCELMECYTRSE